MGVISRMAEKCQKCPKVDECDHKRMEACAYIDDKSVAEAVAMPSAADMASPILRETIKTIVNGEVVEVFKDTIERELYKNLYDGLYCGLINGA